MAYDLLNERIIAGSVSGASTGVKGEMCVGSVPIIVRGVAITTQTANSTSNCVVDFRRRPTAGSSTGEVSIGTITVPSTAVAGRSYYRNGFNVRVNPGESVIATVTTAGGAGFTSMTASVVMELSPEVAENLSSMIASA